MDCGGWFVLWNGFLNFLFSFYVAPNTVKYFSDYFPKCNQTLEKQLFSLKSFTFTNILRWKMFYVETNGALVGPFRMNVCLLLCFPTKAIDIIRHNMHFCMYQIDCHWGISPQQWIAEMLLLHYIYTDLALWLSHTMFSICITASCQYPLELWKMQNLLPFFYSQRFYIYIIRFG